MKENGNWKLFLRPVLVMFAIYLVGISAILLANVHYADDVARTNYGYAGWSAFSRYISTFLSHGVHADGYLTNIAPLPQILASLVLAATSVILICLVSGREIFKEKWTKWILRLIAVTPLAFCPYMLECLSYQYDSIYMALSVFLAVMPFMFYRKKKWQFVLASVIGILGVCMTYQASIGIYLILAVFMPMKDWNNKTASSKEIFKNIVVTGIVFLLTLVFFQKVLMRTQDIYVSNEVPGISELIPSTFSHLMHYFELLTNDFRLLWMIILTVMAAMFVALYAIRSKKNKILATIVGILGLFLMIISAYIIYAVLEKPLYTTRAMYAIGVVIAIVGVYIASGEISKKFAKKRVGKRTEMTVWGSIRVNEIVLAIPVIAICWCFFNFSFTYGNALNEQNNSRNMQIDMVISDLNEIMNDNSVRKIQAIGQIDFAPAIKHMPANKYHILRRLLKPSFETNVPWMAYRLTEGSGIPGIVYDPNINLANNNLPVLKDTALYIIYGDSDSILVKFKGEEFGIWED